MEKQLEVYKDDKNIKKKKQPPKNIFWDISKILSYNALFNFVISNRGGGKTYGFKKYVIKRFIERSSQFMYLRRTEVEIKKARTTFFDDVGKEFPNYTFRTKGELLQMAEIVDTDEDGNPVTGQWQTCGFATHLSGARTQKSVSYEKVDIMCYDEFLIPGYGVAKYLPEEVTCFLEFYETVARLRDVTVFFLANSLNIINPYFMYWNIVKFTGRKGITRVGDDMVMEKVDNMEFMEYKQQTRFGKLVAGTDYERYAIQNEYIENTPEYIEKKTGECYYSATLELDGLLFGCYRSVLNGKYYISQDVDHSFHKTYSCGNVKDVRKLIVKSRTSWVFIDYLIKYFQVGQVMFEDQVVKEHMWEFFRRML